LLTAQSSPRWFLPTLYFRGVKQRGVLLPGGCGRRLAGQIFRRNLSDDHSLVTVVAGTPKRKGWRKIHYVTMLLQCYEFCNLSVLGLGCYERHFYYGNMVGVWWFTWDYYSMNTLWWWAGHLFRRITTSQWHHYRR
jgi:hypothetical protein